MTTNSPTPGWRPLSRWRARTFALSLMVLAVLGLFTASLSSLGTKSARAAGEPPDVVYNRFRAALNQADLDKASLYMADSFRFTLGYETAGKRAPLVSSLPPAAFKQLLGADKYTITPTSETVTGDTATGRFEETYPKVLAAGLTRVIANYQLVVADGKITTYTVYLDTADEQTSKFVSIILKNLAPAPPATGTGVSPSRSDLLPLWTVGGAVLLILSTTALLRSRVRAR